MVAARKAALLAVKSPLPVLASSPGVPASTGQKAPSGEPGVSGGSAKLRQGSSKPAASITNYFAVDKSTKSSSSPGQSKIGDSVVIGTTRFEINPLRPGYSDPGALVLAYHQWTHQGCDWERLPAGLNLWNILCKRAYGFLHVTHAQLMGMIGEYLRLARKLDPPFLERQAELANEHHRGEKSHSSQEIREGILREQSKWRHRLRPIPQRQARERKQEAEKQEKDSLKEAEELLLEEDGDEEQDKNLVSDDEEGSPQPRDDDDFDETFLPEEEGVTQSASAEHGEDGEVSLNQGAGKSERTKPENGIREPGASGLALASADVPRPSIENDTTDGALVQEDNASSSTSLSSTFEDFGEDVKYDPRYLGQPAPTPSLDAVKTPSPTENDKIRPFIANLDDAVERNATRPPGGEEGEEEFVLDETRLTQAEGEKDEEEIELDVGPLDENGWPWIDERFRM